MIILDASPLIALAKIGRLALLKEVYGEVAVGPSVRIEVVEGGKVVDPAGVKQVEAALEARWIRELQPTAEEERLAAQLREHSRLGAGEAEALALAGSRHLLVVLDDKEARVMAQAIGIPYLGTAGVLLEALVRGCLRYDELEEATRDLGTVLWLSPDVVAEILMRARGLKR